MSAATISLEGNLTSDIKFVSTQSGGVFASVGLAVNHRRRDQSGTWVDAGTSFFSLTINNTALLDALRRSPTIGKGTMVMVTGNVKIDRPFTDQSGVYHSAVGVSVSKLGVSPQFATLTYEKIPSQQAPVAQPQVAPPPVQQAQPQVAPPPVQQAPAPAQPAAPTYTGTSDPFSDIVNIFD